MIGFLASNSWNPGASSVRKSPATPLAAAGPSARLRRSAPAQKAQKKLEKEFAARDQELQKMAKQAKDLQAYLEREGVTVSDT